MGFRARLMAWLNFSDLAESNDVPHAQVGESRRFGSIKALDYSPWFRGGGGCEPDSDFYAWNRSLGVPGLSSWTSTAKAAPSPPARGEGGADLAQQSFSQLKAPYGL